MFSRSEWKKVKAMSSLHDEDVPRSGLLGHSLRLAIAVVATGIVVMLFLDAGTPETALRPFGQAPAAVAPAAQSVSRQEAPAGGPVSELVLKSGSYGHFMVDATVNGETLRFMVDTGASSIFLTPQDAERLGWPAQRLDFSERYETAGGAVRAAPVILRSLRIGQLELYDLPASVGEQPGSISLLGMTFLQRFESYEVRGDTLILTW
jgi:aspartyl protease family protein